MIIQSNGDVLGKKKSKASPCYVVSYKKNCLMKLQIIQTQVLAVNNPKQMNTNLITILSKFPGIKAQEIGSTEGKGSRAQGGYSYMGDDGKVYTVTYTADENGFHAQGAHIPTPPPVPEAIAKSLEQNAREEAEGVYNDGKCGT